MAAFNVSVGNQMVMSSAKGRNCNRRHLGEDDGECGCLSKNRKGPKSKNKSLKERIKQFSIWFEEVDNERQKNYAQRRFDRESRREQQRRKVKCFRRLFIPTGICWLLGFCITLASTVPSLGEGTILWTERDKFTVIGPVLLVIGLILLMVTEGLISNHQNLMKKLETREITEETIIEVNPRETNFKVPVLTTRQKTLKAIADKIPTLQSEDETQMPFLETKHFLNGKNRTQERAVQNKRYSVKQRLQRNLGDSYENIQKLSNEPIESGNLPLSAEAANFKMENSMQNVEPQSASEDDKLLEVTTVNGENRHVLPDNENTF